MGMAVSMPGFLSTGSKTQVGGSSSSSSQQSSSFSQQSSSETTEIHSGSDAFGFDSLPAVLGTAGRKRRELPHPERDASSSSVHKK